MAGSTSAPTTTVAASQSQAGAIVAAYIFGGIGVLLVMMLTCVIIRRVKWRTARKYIKRQGERSIPMQAPLANETVEHKKPGKDSSISVKDPNNNDPSNASNGPRTHYIQARERRLEIRKQARLQKALMKQRKDDAKRSISQLLQPGVSSNVVRSVSAPPRSQGVKSNSLQFITSPYRSRKTISERRLDLPGKLDEDAVDSWVAGEHANSNSSNHTVQVEIHVKTNSPLRDSILELDEIIDDDTEV